MKKTKFFLSVLKERDWLEEMAAKGYIYRCQGCGSTKYGTIRKASFDLNIIYIEYVKK